MVRVFLVEVMVVLTQQRWEEGIQVGGLKVIYHWIEYEEVKQTEGIEEAAWPCFQLGQMNGWW